MSARTDLAFGRRGGNWLPDDYVPPAEQGPLCGVCREPMLVGQRGRHHGCDSTTLAGTRCTCPPGCTDRRVGDKGTCDPQCVPCRLRANEVHDEVAEWRRRPNKKKSTA